MPSVPLITKKVPEGEDRRSALRQRLGSITYLDLGANNGGFLIDVGEGGIQFQVANPLVSDGTFHIKFKLSKTRDAIEALAQVAWLDGSGKYGGLQFHDLDEQSKLQIREWLTAQIARKIRAQLEEHAGNLDEATGTPEPQLSLASETKNSHVQAARDSSQTQLQVNSLGPPVEAPILHAEGSTNASGRLNHPFQMSRTFLLKVIGSFAVVAVVSVFLLQLSRGRTVNLDTPTPKGAVSSPLELKLERSGTDWRVSWNRNADVLLQAVGGHLSITDGSLRKELDLDPSELRSGSVMYTPLTGDLLVRLQVVGGHLAQPVSESVRVIAGTGASSQTASSRSPSSESTDPKFQHPSTNIPLLFSKKSEDEPSSKTSAPLTQSPSNAIPPKLESPKVRADSDKIEASANSLSQTPGVKPALAEPAFSPPTASVLTPSTLPESIRKPPPASLPPFPPSRDTVPSGGKVDPPQLILRREPVYPSQATQFGFAGEVEVHFFISPQGTVHNVTVVRGNPLLANSAVIAVSGWRYKPALLNGSPIETEARTVFVFKPK
jgi:TonB family protein